MATITPVDNDEEKAELLEGDPLESKSLLNMDMDMNIAEVIPPSLETSGPRSQTIWIVSASIALSSTRYILITQHFHFPMILLAWQLAATALLVSLRLFVRKRTLHRDSPNSRAPDAAGFPLNIRALIALLLAVVALPVTYQAILHFPNVASLVMFSLHAVAVSELFRLAAANLLRPSKACLKVVGLATVCAVFTYVMLARDYRLTSRGDRSLFVSTYLTAGAQTILTLGKRRERQTVLSFDYFQLILTFLALILALSWYVPYEGPYTSLQMPNFWLLSLNLLATAFAISSGGSLLVPLCEPQEPGSNDSIQFSSSLRPRVLVCFSVTGIVALSSLLLPNRGYVSAIQLVFYGISLAALLIGNVSFTKSSFRRIFRQNGINKFITSFAILCWITYIPLNFTDFPFGQSLPVPYPQIDHNYLTSHRFDIVVAHFDEKPDQIARLVSRITSTPIIRNLNPRLYIYTKGEAVDPNKFRISLQKAFTADPRNKNKYSYLGDAGEQRTRAWPHMDIHPLPNFGREGASYMSHIAKYYDTMAQHTLFTQGTVHDMEDFIARLQYFVPGPPIDSPSALPIGAIAREWWAGQIDAFTAARAKGKPPPPQIKQGRSTGMLPLGFQTETCDCHKCSDSWGWYDTSRLVTQMFNFAFGLSAQKCRTILLTYKGQFIASAQRMRGIGRSPYVDLRDGLTREDRWEHSKEYLEKYTGHGGVNNIGPKNHRWGEKDTLERPWFGYTMERMWGVLMQCSDMSIAWKCPTLKSRWRGSFGGDKGDCQCFDMVRPPDSDA